MLKFSKTGPLKVALLSVGSHNRAILEFFFAGAGRSLFKTVSIAEADALIVDYDHVGAKDEWEQQAGTNKPGVILSVHPVALPNTIWIPKPLTSKALTEAVGRVHALAAAVESVTPVQVQPKREVEQEKPATPAATVPQQLFGASAFPQPFGVSSKPARKLRSLIIDVSDDDDDGDALITKPSSPDVDVVEEVVFDPAEADISLEEVARTVEPEVDPAIAERRWRELCGERDDIDELTGWKMDEILFTPENYLLSNVLGAVRLAHQSNQSVQLKLPGGGYALLMAETGQAYCTLDTHSDEFAMLCNNPVQTGQVALHIPSSSELLPLEEDARQHEGDILDLEGFIWVTSLLTAQGRLSRSVDVNKRIALKHWPNMTRLEQFPQVMRIAALWGQRPGTLFEIAKALDIPQRYVFSFYTAASALNLFELDQTKLKSREKEKPKESRGLFSRLLKRLLGGGKK
jgi:hypothetical protein